MNKLLLFIFLSVSICIQGQELARGADVGWLSEMEQSGRIWRDSNGVQKDLFDILPDYCINSIRLRVWVNPSGGWSGKQDVINLAKRAIAKGYRLMIDFHYSDSWADPGQQTKPAAWANYSVNQIAQAVYNHTNDVLSGLKEAGVTPEWVQVGNETNNGMIWPEGQASTNMANYALFVESGYQSVKNVFPNAKVIVHVSNGYDNSLFRWNIGGLVSNGAHFDIIAMSMYPDTPAEWSTYAQQALTNMQDLVARYNKDIMVSEIGLATNSATEGREFVEKVIQNLQSMPNNRGLGVFWWEPQAYNWRGYEKVAWNGNTGQTPYEATEAMNGFKYNCSPQNPKDCHGIENGEAYFDACGKCVGGTTGLIGCEKVNVTFKVDMTGIDVSQGVFITGTMTETNGDWQIIPMNNEGNNIYSYSLEMFPEDTGAYYFLNANDWGARESVPTECVVYWQDRGFTVPYQTVVFNHVWASCEELVISINSKQKLYSAFPNPFTEDMKLTVLSETNYELVDMQGGISERGICKRTCQIGTNLSKGVYVMKLVNSDKVQIVTIVKE